MSALDRAFIKAFAKEASGDRSANRRVTGSVTGAATAKATGVLVRGLESREAFDRDRGADTIPMAQGAQDQARPSAPRTRASTVAKPHFGAASLASAARPMSEADRRAFERSSEDENIIELAADASSPIARESLDQPQQSSPISTPGSGPEAASLADTKQRIARLDAASKASAPHFAIDGKGKASASPEIKSSTSAPREFAASLPAAVRLPPLPMPAAADASASEQARVEVSEPSPLETDFTPVWEVDRFVWPAVCDKLVDDWSPALASVVESIRQLHLEFAQRDEEDRAAPIVAVASFGRGEGRTTASACLARACANGGIRTCLLDGDFENPQLGSVLGLNSLAGWEDVMLARLPLEEAAVLSIEDQFTLMPALHARPAADLFGTRKTHRALANLAARFDLIVLDLGPIVEDQRGAYASVERCPFDAAVMVRDLRWTTESQLAEAVDQIESLGASLLAIVENFAESRLPSPSRPAGRRRERSAPAAKPRSE